MEYENVIKKALTRLLDGYMSEIEENEIDMSKTTVLSSTIIVAVIFKNQPYRS